MNAIAEFVHISDTQLRDQRAFDTSLATWINDLLVDVTIRRPYMEQFDALLLSAYLSTYGKTLQYSNNCSAKGNDHGKMDHQYNQALPFLIHTGDLLDISIASELMQAMTIFGDAAEKYAEYDFRLFSAAGNHDGLAFGNIKDYKSDNRSLGINKTEFVLAHALEPKHSLMAKSAPETDGYGFGRNEILQAFWKDECRIPIHDSDTNSSDEWINRITKWCKHIRRSRERITKLTTPVIENRSLSPPS